MKKELRTIRLNLNINNAMCSCPAGLSGYCNHVIALLLELADYSLNQLQKFPRRTGRGGCTNPELCLRNLAKLWHDGQKQVERYFLNVLPPFKQWRCGMFGAPGVPCLWWPPGGCEVANLHGTKCRREAAGVCGICIPPSGFSGTSPGKHSYFGISHSKI